MFLRCGFTKIFSEFITVPFKEIKPLSNFSSPETLLRKVVFPEPLSPTNDKISPLLIEKLRFFKTGLSLLYDFLIFLTKKYIYWLKYFFTTNKVNEHIPIIKRENIEDKSTISSTASSYVFVESVLKLNGISISVIGNSFITSIKQSIKAPIIPNLFNGKYIFLSSAKLFKPRFCAFSKVDFGIFSILDFNGDLPTLKILLQVRK